MISLWSFVVTRVLWTLCQSGDYTLPVLHQTKRKVHRTGNQTFYQINQMIVYFLCLSSLSILIGNRRKIMKLLTHETDEFLLTFLLLDQNIKMFCLERMGLFIPVNAFNFPLTWKPRIVAKGVSKQKRCSSFCLSVQGKKIRGWIIRNSKDYWVGCPLTFET